MSFVFRGYEFDQATRTATFSYSFDDRNLSFKEVVQFAGGGAEYDREALVRALDLAHILIGTSYYKTFPTKDVRFANGGVDGWQADFFNKVYQEGMSQFAFENHLTRADLARFTAGAEGSQPVSYEGDGVIALQSGGKDSLLTAALLREKNVRAKPLYVTSSDSYPAIIDSVGAPLVIKRTLDHAALNTAKEQGGLNGHVPVTYIVLSLGLIQAILSGKDTVLASIGREGEEPHAWIDDLPVNHQWSKTWLAEQAFADYVQQYISADIRVGSPLRQYSEVKIAELFAEECWEQYGHSFSSCNVANYEQGADNTLLKWCGECPKCANSYLLFAPFIPPAELASVFGGDLFAKASLAETFKGLLGVDGAFKPFECVGEVAELGWAYHAAQQGGYTALSLDVPVSDFDKDITGEAQDWAKNLMRL